MYGEHTAPRAIRQSQQGVCMEAKVPPAFFDLVVRSMATSAVFQPICNRVNERRAFQPYMVSKLCLVPVHERSLSAAYDCPDHEHLLVFFFGTHRPGFPSFLQNLRVEKDSVSFVLTTVLFLFVSINLLTVCTVDAAIKCPNS